MMSGNRKTKKSLLVNNSTCIASTRNPHSRLQQGIGCWRRLLAASLTLGVAAVLQTQTVRADSVIFDDHFNNATNDLSNNDSGVGGGFTAFSYNNLVNAFATSE